MSALPDEQTMRAPPPPQTKAIERRGSTHRRGWAIALVVLAAAAYPAYLAGEKVLHSSRAKDEGRSKPADRRIPVLAATARQGDLPIYLDGLGTVTAFKTATIRSRVDGLLTKVNFTEGQMVQEGDLLAEVDVRPFEADLENKTGVLNQALAQVDLAMVTLNHLKEMSADSASPIEYQSAEATVKQASAAVEAAKAMVETARLNVEWCHITAPISGRIGLRAVDQGNLIHTSDPNGVAVITQFQPISVIFNLPQDRLPQLLKAHEGNHPLAADAFSSDFKTRIATGELAAIDNQIDPGTGTARLKATFENRDDALYPNQFVNVRLLVETRKDVVLVPVAAVQVSPTTPFVYVVVNHDSVDLRPITPGPSEHGSTVIEKGLEAGELVVIDGVDKLQPGSKVSVRDAESRPSAKKP